MKKSKKIAPAFERLARLRNSQELTWNQLAQKLGVGVSMLMMVKSGKRNLSEKVMIRLEWMEVDAGIKPASKVSRVAKEAGRKPRSSNPPVVAEDMEKGYFDFKPEYKSDTTMEELPITIRLIRPQPEGTARLGEILGKSFDFDIILLACLDPEIRKEDFLDQLDITSRQLLRDTAMTLVFGVGWRSLVANLAVESRIGPSPVVKRILGN